MADGTSASGGDAHTTGTLLRWQRVVRPNDSGSLAVFDLLLEGFAGFANMLGQ